MIPYTLCMSWIFIVIDLDVWCWFFDICDIEVALQNGRQSFPIVGTPCNHYVWYLNWWVWIIIFLLWISFSFFYIWKFEFLGLVEIFPQSWNCISMSLPSYKMMLMNFDLQKIHLDSFEDITPCVDMPLEVNWFQWIPMLWMKCPY